MFRAEAAALAVSGTGAVLSWVDKIDLILRWGAATTAIVVGCISIYQRCRRK
jgi:membrane protein DedA with SNARE-associated domain